MSAEERVREARVGEGVRAGRTPRDRGAQPPPPHPMDRLTEVHRRQGFTSFHSQASAVPGAPASSMGGWGCSLEARLMLL